MAVLYPDNVGTFPFTTQYHIYLISSVPLFDVCAGVSHQFVRFYFIAKNVLIHLIFVKTIKSTKVQKGIVQ